MFQAGTPDRQRRSTMAAAAAEAPSAVLVSSGTLQEMFEVGALLTWFCWF